MFETEQLNKKLHLYQATVILSVLFAFIGYSYNVWRRGLGTQQQRQNRLFRDVGGTINPGAIGLFRTLRW